ncbi:MAG: Fic family protein [Microcoleus sp. PH2017_10_PVI_O_A]|uniref:Fic family protein n=1 Tax=unclassified Microcoleus TaxID=2642155 RepID=UPI001D642CE0|nr:MULTISPECIES: Fic family protein [unclassified Microcoleus]TAE82791.1 MAG: Fic family protein [Oscillatoriales cyanobacterium]MCC3406613.1 Fic family protein [Microcoleus sp. PH2017_10_PVI_O_A]MCC3460625.1 Fic family protein [Microcoleus sp. PH2017_11_PCY_U_A]MCC3479172.1 Fic family protein [Microcoleus sp. PH2017_12_PCY_D_A]MCC3526550.1 Fic family protein [Microcoleus sp. PH2017_21_RUC_O_A]
MPSFTKKSERAGQWVRQGSGETSYEAFIPAPLPPDPAIMVDSALQRRLEAAGFALGRLDGIGRLLPGPEELLYSYIRKEAVLSSQIEGTQSSIADLLLHENQAVPGVVLEDVQEVSNYIGALSYGIERLSTLPLSLRLIRESHERLVRGTRGDRKAPGEFRRSQNWIGGSKPSDAMFVPPPPHELPDILSAFEKFLHSAEYPVLLKVGLAHGQFETIHPFLDGNGRVGRMLIALMLVEEGVLERPWLYVSLHFKKHRDKYYRLLQEVRTQGNWEEWLIFFLEGVTTIANQATEKIRALMALFERDRKVVEQSRKGSIYQSVAVQSNLTVYDYLKKKIAIRIPETADACGTTKPTVKRAIEDLQQLGIVTEVTGKPRNKVYLYQEYLDILNQDDGTSELPNKSSNS